MARHLAKCPKCGQRVDYESAAGGVLVCPGCQARLRVPARDRAPSPTEAPTETQPPPPEDPLIGQMLGEFEVVATIGRGGMGAVYKARQPALNRHVAIKVIPNRLASDASFIERFHREARAAAAIRHPNIIEVHTIGKDKGLEFIAMEFVDGESLSDLLKREGRLAPGRAVELMQQVASALAKAHAGGIVHRDIKPANILLTSDGMVKVADFGLAKHEGVDVSVTATGASLGTPMYMPPEIAEGKPAELRSDLYSLGATFYQAIAGKPPFDGATPAELIIKHVNVPPPPLQTLAPDCPAPLCRIIHRLLSKNPAHRYSSAQKLLDALGRLPPSSLSLGERAGVRVPAAARGDAQADTLTKHPHPPLGPRPGSSHAPKERARAARRKPLLIAGAAIAVVLVVVLVLALGRRGPRPASSVVPSTRTPTTEHRTPASDVLEQHAALCLQYARTCAERNDWAKAKEYLDDLAGKYAATRFAGDNKSAISALRAQAAAALKPTPTPKVGPKVEPKAEPSEEWITLSNGWRVGKPVNLGPTVNSPQTDCDPAVSADGLTLLFASDRGGGQGNPDIWMSTRRTPEAPWGRPVNLGPPVNTAALEGGPRLSADGKSLFFHTGRPAGAGGKDLWVWDFQKLGQPGGNLNNLGPTVNSPQAEECPCISADGLSLLFSSNRPNGLGGYDIWMSQRPSKSDPWGKPGCLSPALNSRWDERGPCLSADGLTLFFGSTRPGGHGGADLWMCTRQTNPGPFGDPVNLGAQVNSGEEDFSPWLSPDRQTLYFHSDRPGGRGSWDVWQAPILPPGAPLPEPPIDEARWGPWEDLFDGKSLEGWRVVEQFPATGPPPEGGRGGHVHVSDGQMIFGLGDRFTGVVLARTMPTTDYEIELEAMRVTGDGGDLVAVTFPVGDSRTSFVLNGGRKGFIGLQAVDGRAVQDNVTKRATSFERGTWYRVRLRVTPPGIVAWLDGQRVLSFSTAERRLSVLQEWRQLVPLGLTASCGQVQLRNIRLRRLKTEAPPPADEARWGPWEELFDGKTLKGWRIPEKPAGYAEHGEVRVQDGRIVLGAGNPLTGIAWTGDFPASDYELCYEAMPIAAGADFASAYFPVGDSACALIVASRYTALDCVDGLRHYDNGTARKWETEVGAHWYAVRLRVTGSRIEAWVDQAKIVDLPTAGRRFSTAGHDEALRPFGLHTYKAVGAVRNIRLRRLKPEAPPPDDEARWGPWEDLFDGKSLTGWRIADQGFFAKHGPVHVRDGQIALARGDALTGIAWVGDFPRGDYEVQIESANIEGSMPCGVVLPVGGSHCLACVEHRSYTPPFVGLHLVDGETPGLGVRRAGEASQVGRWYRLRIRVADGRLRIWIEDEELGGLVLADRTFTMENTYSPQKPFGLHSWNTTGALRSIRLRRLKPEAAGAGFVRDGLLLSWEARDVRGRPDARLVPDASGNGNDGKMVGEVRVADGPARLQFDGNSYVVAVKPVRPEHLTVEALFRLSRVEGDEQHICTTLRMFSEKMDAVPNPRQWFLKVEPKPNAEDPEVSGRLTFAVFTRDLQWHVALSDAPVDSAWHHVVGTFDGKMVRLVVDGRAQSRRHPRGYHAPEYAGSVNQPTAEVIKPPALGSMGGSERTGLMGDAAALRVYSRALSAEEIAQNHRHALRLVPDLAPKAGATDAAP